MQQAVLAMSLQEQLSLCSDEEESDEEEGNEEACGGKSDEVYDDGKFTVFIFYFFKLNK
jgi:type IV secretory pathway VirB9-like protein